MKDVYTFEGTSESESAVNGADFVEQETTSKTKAKVVDPVVQERHRQIKCGVINTLATVGINSIPIIVQTIKNKKEGIPNKINKFDVIRTAVSTAFPILETVDAAFLGNKLEKTVHLKDVRNVVNIAMTYPAAHRTLNDLVNRTVQRTNENGQPIVETEKTDAGFRTCLGIANLLVPYFTNKFTDNNLTFMQKLGSAVPIPILGRGIRILAQRNPTLNNLYETGTGLLKVASGSAKSIGTAVRAKPNSVLNKATSTVSNVADTIGDILGVPRGNIGYGGGYYNPYGGSYGTRWGSSGQVW